MLKIKGALKYAYARGLIPNDFGHLLKAKGKETEKRTSLFQSLNLKTQRLLPIKSRR